MFASKKAPQLGEFGELFTPGEAAEPILDRPVRTALTEWLTEIWAADELAAAGLKPRSKALFDGPPGVGKTTLGHHLAARLGLPMLAVRPDRIIDKWVGSTGQNIGDLFECVRANGPVLLFLDEFDALGGKRRSVEQAADAHRNEAINTLLQRLEQYDGFVIAATNFGRELDPAIWRRFDLHITLELPGQTSRERIVARYLAPFGLPAPALKEWGEALAEASPALIRALCEGIKRQVVIGPKLGSDMRRDAVFERVLTSVHPHPDLGKPRLWSHLVRDRAVQLTPWPLPRAEEVAAPPPQEPAPDDKVVRLEVRR